MRFVKNFDPSNPTLPVDFHPPYQRGLNELYVRKLQAAIRAGEELPPITLACFPDDGGYELIDGQHRVEAAKREGAVLSATVSEMQRADAVSHFLNLQRGRPLAADDKVRADTGIVAMAIRAANVSGPLAGRIKLSDAKTTGKLAANQLVQAACAYYGFVTSGSVDNNLKKLAKANRAEMDKLLDHIGRIVYGEGSGARFTPRGLLVALGILTREEGFRRFNPGSLFLTRFRSDWSKWNSGKYGAGSREAAKDIANQLRSHYSKGKR